MLESVEWGEYKLGNLFYINNTLSFNKNKLTSGDDYDYVTRTSQNQGILQSTGFVNQENINPSGTWSLGLLQMDFFYRHKPWYAGQFVRKITPKFTLSEKNIPYFSALLNKQKKILLSGLVRDVDNTFLETKIQLPTKNGEIDFDFMERFITELEAQRITELEAQRITELEAYLLSTGLKDYKLTNEEEKVLSDFEKGEFDWGEYKIGDIFSINSYKKRFDANKVTILNSGKPYVVRTSINNGLRGYINEDKEFLNEGNTISFGQDTATMFYQEKPYFTGDKIKILKSKSNKLKKSNAQFFISSMTRSFSSFTWGSSSFNINIIGNQLIQLPMKNNEPDYELMETLMSAIQKIVIHDVVEYADKKIEATRKVVER